MVAALANPSVLPQFGEDFAANLWQQRCLMASQRTKRTIKAPKKYVEAEGTSARHPVNSA